MPRTPPCTPEETARYLQIIVEKSIQPGSVIRTKTGTLFQVDCILPNGRLILKTLFANIPPTVVVEVLPRGIT